MAKRKRNVSKRKVPKRRRRKRRFGMGVAMIYGPKIIEMTPLIAEQKYIGALKKIKPIEAGITALTKQLDKIVALQNMPTIFTKFMNPLLLGLKIDLAGQEKFTQTEGKIKETKEALKKMGEDEVKLTAEYATAKSKIMMKVPPNKDIKEMQKIINSPPFIPVKTGLRKSLPSALLLFLIEDKETPKTNATLAKFTVEKIKAAKKKVEDAVKKKTPPANKATAATTTATTTTATTPPTKAPASTFGKRKRGPSASLKRMCKKNGVRLMVKRGKTRVYKSSKVLKEQCQNKLKKNKKKNFGRKKIKRFGIMPPRKRKTRGKKRRSGTKGKKYPKTFKKLMKKMYRGTKKRGSAAARYASKNPGYAAAGLAGLGALGLGGFEAKRARERYLLDKANPYYSRTRRSGGEERLQSIDHLQEYQGYKAQRKALESPTGRFVRGVRDYDYRGAPRRAYTGATTYPYRRRAGEFYTGAKAAPGAAYAGAKTKAGKAYSGFMGLFKSKPPTQAEYGKRRRRRRRKKRSFGKKAKKPSAALKRLCKKHKVRLTLKRGGKRVYKSEAMLKKQCKKAMKRKKKKSKK
jgi:hypothetical protein